MGPTGAARIVQVHPTRRCNLRCLHCYSNSGPEQRETLALPLLQTALQDAAAEGYTILSVSGGEPLLYAPLRELLLHAHALGLGTTVTTNAMLLDERRLAGLVGAADLVAISLDGVPEAHDRMRGHPHAFATMRRRLEGVRRSGIPFGFIFTLTQFNVNELAWVAEFALEQGAQLLQVHPLEPVGRARETLVDAEPDAVESSFAYLETKRIQALAGDRLFVQLDVAPRRALEAHPEKGYAGVSGAVPARLADLLSPLVIETDGTVVPLQHGFPRAFALGNLHDRRLGELAADWRHRAAGAFQRLCREVHDELTAPDAPPMVNWYERIARRAAQDASGVVQRPTWCQEPRRPTNARCRPVGS